MKVAAPVALVFIIFTIAASIQAQTDLSMREALYFTGSKTTIDLAKDKFVAKGATLNLSAELAKNCDGPVCEFNIGFIGFRTGNTASALSSYGRISVTGMSADGSSILFASGETTRQVVVPVNLKLGMNKLTFTIDPDKKTQETNEGNNTFSVNVIVNWRRANPGKD